MTIEVNTPVKPKSNKVTLVLSIIVFLFWLTNRLINVYDSPGGGAVFEMLWLPVILMTLLVPVMSLIIWINEKYHPKSPSLYALIISIATILMMFIK